VSEDTERDYTTVSISIKIASKIDKIIINSCYLNRADFIRDAVREHLKKFEGV